MKKNLKNKIKEFQRFIYISTFIFLSIGIAGNIELDKPVSKEIIILYVISFILTILVARYDNKKLNRG